MKANIEEQLRQAVLTAGVLRSELARASGVSEGQLSRFIHGLRSLTLPAAAKLADAMGLELRPARRKAGRRMGRDGKGR